MAHEYHEDLETRGTVPRKKAIEIAETTMREARSRAAQVRTDSVLKTTNLIARRRSVRRILRDNGPCAIGAATDADVRRAVVSSLSPAKHEGEPCLAVVEESYDLTRSGSAKNIKRAEALDDIRVTCLMRRHTLERVAQRGGVHNIERLQETMRPVWGWFRAACSFLGKGSFMIPTEDGFACCERVDANVGGRMRPATMLRTFIDYETMRPHYQDAWRRITAVGALDIGPGCPTLSSPGPEQVAALEIMRDEGRKWEARRDHAQRRSERENEKDEKDRIVPARLQHDDPTAMMIVEETGEDDGPDLLADFGQ